MTKEFRTKVWEYASDDVQDAVADRLEEGRGKLGNIDKNLPAAIKQLANPAVQKLLKPKE